MLYLYDVYFKLYLSWSFYIYVCINKKAKILDCSKSGRRTFGQSDL
jgi:hypothetical protein